MNIAVAGLWHLGCVTAACCARHFRVTGLDFDGPAIAKLRQGKAPLFEPGLDALITEGIQRGALDFTTDPQQACADADVLWLCNDTPVDENDASDVGLVLERARRILPHLRPGTLALVSAQLPVGTCRKIQDEYPALHVACSPENLRLGKAIEAFEKPERVIVGTRDPEKHALLRELFAPFTGTVLFMRTESAEMVKHALNSFLALSITFINEIARLCEREGADAREVAAGLKSDARIGPRAYLGPGGPFAGGTLARDVVSLIALGDRQDEPLAVLPAIKQSNDLHREWNWNRLERRLGGVRGRVVAVLGLTYKPGTDTLRRSAAVELCRKLLAAGASVRVSDPVVKALPPDLSGAAIAASAAEALTGADAAVVCTEWPEFRRDLGPAAIRTMRQRIVIDANRFLEKELQGIPGLEHLSVGRPS